MSDTITVQNLVLHVAGGVGPSAFGLANPPPCPVELDIEIVLHRDVVPHCVEQDEMQGLGVNYSSVSKAVYAALTEPGKVWATPAEVMSAAAAVPLELAAVDTVNIRARFPRALLHARAAEYGRAFSAPVLSNPHPLSCTLRDIRVACIIGLHPHERAERQRLEVDVGVRGVDGVHWDHKAVHDEAYKWLEQSSFGTLEGLVDSFALHLLHLPQLAGCESVEVTVRKPSALPFATPCIRIQRGLEDYSRRKVTAAGASAELPGPSQPRVFIAVGSNIGDRLGNIRRAVQELEEHGCTLIDTSRLYESKPMYVEDQARFTNGVVEVETTLPPMDLLRLLKRTETSVGRTATFRNGPRVIDLDLVLYGEEVVQIGKAGDVPDEDGVAWLTVPHASMEEREFVLRPLADIAPELKLPGTSRTVLDSVKAVETPSQPEVVPIIPFHAPAAPLPLSPETIPHIMAIFNATPDSFSDGHASRVETGPALGHCMALMGQVPPPAILDIGGMSTRPGSEPCSEDEELARVIPLIKAIRRDSNATLNSVPISVDTYRASVARLAVEAGGSCINDVRGGSEPGMLEVMAATDVPVVIMHSRGDSTTMTDPENQVYDGGVVAGVRAELAERVAAARAAGVKRWNIILDPGLGFAKSQQDNLRLLEGIAELQQGPLRGYSLLVGASRKGFVGRVTGRVAAERGAGDAAVNSWCAASGVVDVLRVHDARSAEETVRMTNAIRGRGGSRGE